MVAIGIVCSVRRKASTGVIGDNQILSSSAVLNSLGLGTDISSKTVRYSPSTTTLMDLIQEDYLIRHKEGTQECYDIA